MSSMRPCPYCGQGQFLYVPGAALELKKPQERWGTSTYDAQYAHVHVNLMVCTGCSRVEWFATNGQALQGLPGATFVQAAPGAP